MTAPSLRVLHVLEATLGGTRRYLEDVAVASAGLPLVQGLVYGTSRSDPGFNDLLRLVREAGWFVVPVADLRRAVRPGADARSALAVRRAIVAFKPSIVHLHSSKAGAVGRIAARSCWPRSPRVVYSPHALPSRLGSAYMLAERMLAPLTNRFIAVSESERKEIVSEGIADSARVDVVYPRIDTAAYAPRNQQEARRELDLPPDAPIVIGIGRLAPQKNPHSFVQALAQVRASQPAVIGIWVGDGELRGEIETLAATRQLGDSFRIAGWRTDVRPYIAACDVLLSTSRYESFGYVIPETFAMERPVVATRVTGTVDVFFPAARRLLFAPEKIDEAAQSIAGLITNKELSTTLGRIGRLSVIERFSTGALSTALYTSYSASLI